MFQIAKPKKAQKKIMLFVEGDTEKNYFSTLRNKNKDSLSITFSEYNIGGGGYSSVIKKLKKEAPSYGCLAIFIIIDLDKFNSEKEQLQELIEYCKIKNSEKSIPYFLIGTNEDFEYFACCHCNDYNNDDIKRFIPKKLPYKDVTELKSDKDIYSVLNRDGRSYANAIAKIKKKKEKTYIWNNYTLTTKELDIMIQYEKININEDHLTYKHSNIDELFDIIFYPI